jgi:mannan endo-1,6-alpha-mannosidase
VDYWSLTGDAQYNKLVQSAIQSQAGEIHSFMPSSQRPMSGNSDQAIWGITAIDADEKGFTGSSDGSYLDMAKAVFEQQVVRWDNYTCAGGLRSKINPDDVGFEYKDSFSTGTFFQLAARLALRTQNSTYTQWASKAYDWAVEADLVNEQGWTVMDGTNSSNNCSSVSQTQWSANAGTFLYGSAVMYNLVGINVSRSLIINYFKLTFSCQTFQQTWATRTTGFLTSVNRTFFPSGVIEEPSCNSQCTTSQRAFKSLLIRWLARTGSDAPFTTSQVHGLLTKTASLVVGGCSNSGNSTCASNGQNGLGEQLTALDSILALLVGRPADVASPSSTSSPPSPSGTKASAAPRTASVNGLIVLSVVIFVYVHLIL